MPYTVKKLKNNLTKVIQILKQNKYWINETKKEKGMVLSLSYSRTFLVPFNLEHFSRFSTLWTTKLLCIARGQKSVNVFLYDRSWTWFEIRTTPLSEFRKFLALCAPRKMHVVGKHLSSQWEIMSRSWGRSLVQIEFPRQNCLGLWERNRYLVSIPFFQNVDQHGNPLPTSGHLCGLIWHFSKHIG